MGAAGREGKGEGDEEGDGEEKVTVEGEVVTTEGAQRGGGCSYHTQSLASMPDQQELSPDQVTALRQELEQQLSTWTQVRDLPYLLCLNYSNCKFFFCKNINIFYYLFYFRGFT